MRALRWLVPMAILAPLLALAPPAAADGGAYIELDRTYYRVGSTASAVAYVAVPPRKQGVFDRGPFFLYLVPIGEYLDENRPLPRAAVRLGAITIADEGHRAFELSTTFTVPDVEDDTYNVQVCNDPCTVSGFREPLTGFMIVAATRAEASLHRQVFSLQSRIGWIRGARTRLHNKLEGVERELVEAETDRDDLRTRLAAGPAAPPAAEDDRPLLDGWAFVTVAGAAIVALTVIGLGIAFSRRRDRTPIAGRTVVTPS